MKHSASRQLYAYWDRLRGERSAPERSEIEPGQIRHLLADSLILEIDAGGASTLRLAGTRVCALFGRELRGLPLTDLWGEAGGRPGEAGRIVGTVAGETVGVVAGLRGLTTGGEGLDLELLLLPLRHHGRTQARALGALSPAAMPVWLGLRPLARLDTVSVRILRRGDGAPPPPANDAAPVRRRHLLVHPGGRV